MINYNLFRAVGDVSNCRKLLNLSVNSVSDDPERVCNALIQFEREQGYYIYEDNIKLVIVVINSTCTVK